MRHSEIDVAALATEAQSNEADGIRGAGQPVPVIYLVFEVSAGKRGGVGDVFECIADLPAWVAPEVQ